MTLIDGQRPYGEGFGEISLARHGIGRAGTRGAKGSVKPRKYPCTMLADLQNTPRKRHQKQVLK
jgi:hypothetical protein